MRKIDPNTTDKDPDATPKEPAPGELADPGWFREPTRREQWIGGGLFTGFGLFFLLWFYVQRGSSFRWLILGLGVISIVRGLYHAIKAMMMKRKI
jgi:hypothetical protein